ncbi:MASE1 domain-containing protein [Candidatus Kaiserbacteria bacterium]|nr:MASE1 domain-containing protein [Candidatus Kaiserbacteria bacterium]
MYKVLARVRYADILRMIGVFVVVLASQKAGQYVFFTMHTSPALIWPATGISLAAMLLWGYRMWIPIAAAALIAVLTSPIGQPIPVIVVATFAQAIHPVVGVYLLRRSGFENTFGRVRDIISFILVAFITSMITPSLVVLAHLATHSLMSTVLLTWTRSWAGRVLSVLVLTPLILSLTTRPRFKLSRNEAIEETIVLVLLSALLFVMFWTSLSADYATLFSYSVLALLAWIALRFNLRIMTRALFILAAVSMSGVIIYHGGPRPINEQLYGIELGLLLFMPIFYLFAVLSDERWVAARSLEVAVSKLDAENNYKNEFIPKVIPRQLAARSTNSRIISECPSTSPKNTTRA